MDTINRNNTDQQAAQADRLQIGQRIVEIRNRRGWSQRELARRAGLLPPRLSKLERGLKPMMAGELVRLSRALETGLDELALGGEQPRTRLLDLARELAALGTPEEIAGLGRLLELFLLGYRAAAAGRPSC